MKKIICWTAALSMIITSLLPLSTAADVKPKNNINAVSAELMQLVRRKKRNYSQQAENAAKMRHGRSATMAC